MSQTPAFDPYHELLGIALSEQPASYYRLLGITQFESSPTVIERAADRQMAHLRTFQIGKHQADSQRLLNEISRARQTLLNDTERVAYDAKLKQQLAEKEKTAKPIKAGQARPTPPKPLAVASPAPVVPVAQRLPAPIAVPPQSPPQQQVPLPTADPFDVQPAISDR